MASARPVPARGPFWVGWRRPGLRGEHAPFLVLLAFGAVVRVGVQLAFTPAFVFSDGPTYLSFLSTFEPTPDRPVGYALLLLLPLSWLSDAVLLVAVAQHVLGLASAGLLYALLRRWGVTGRVAALATVPVLFDTLQLVLEHSVLSDVLFELMLLAAVAALGWQRRPALAAALLAGLLLGTAVTVRQVGEPLVLAGVGYCLLVGGAWRRRLTAAVVLTVGFALPIGAYATWYHHERGVYALSEFVGKALYMRTTTFVECADLSVPDYQRVLCPREPRGERLDPTEYAYHDERTLPRLHPPAGTTLDQAMRDFAIEAIREQPVDYAGIVVRDFALNFTWSRNDRYEYDTAFKWTFGSYRHREPTAWTGPAYAAHGGRQLASHEPFAGALVVYSFVAHLPGPLLLGCLLLGLAGGLGVGRAKDSGLRSRCLLVTVSGTGLMLVPDLTAEFVWRYQLPALALLPAGAALAYTALRGSRAETGTWATASTD